MRETMVWWLRAFPLGDSPGSLFFICHCSDSIRFCCSQFYPTDKGVRNSSLWGWWGSGTDCPEHLWQALDAWKCPRPGLRGFGATWDSGRCPCPWKRAGTAWSLISLPTQTILCASRFYIPVNKDEVYCRFVQLILMFWSPLVFFLHILQELKCVLE